MEDPVRSNIVETLFRQGYRLTPIEVEDPSQPPDGRSQNEWLIDQFKEAILDAFEGREIRPRLIQIEAPVLPVVDCALCHVSPKQSGTRVDDGGGPGPFSVGELKIECPRCHSHTQQCAFDGGDWANRARKQWNDIHGNDGKL